MRTRSEAALTLILSLVAVAPSLAHAQDLGFGAHSRPTGQIRITPRWDTYAFGQNIDVLGATVNTTSWANVFSAQADFDQFVLNVAIPLGFVHVGSSAFGTSTSNEQAELGNLELEGYADIDLGPEHRLLVGGGVALPTATDQLTTTTSRGLAVRAAAWVTSFRNPAAWADQSFGIWATASYRLAIPWFLFTATGSIPFFLPTSGERGGGYLYRGNVEMMLSLDVAGAVRIVDVVDVGASFMGFALPSGAGATGNPDLGQTAATIFVRTDEALDLPVGAGFEMIFNLDNTWGPTGDSGKYWGAHIFVFGRFDVGDRGQVEAADFDPTDGGGAQGASSDGASTDATAPAQ